MRKDLNQCFPFLSVQSEYSYFVILLSEQVAEVLATFMVRHKFAEPAANFTRLVLPESSKIMQPFSFCLDWTRIVSFNNSFDLFDSAPAYLFSERFLLASRRRTKTVSQNPPVILFLVFHEIGGIYPDECSSREFGEKAGSSLDYHRWIIIVVVPPTALPSGNPTPTPPYVPLCCPWQWGGHSWNHAPPPQLTVCLSIKWHMVTSNIAIVRC